MTMPQASTLAVVAHCVEVREVLVTSCQAHSLVVVLHLLLCTGVVVLVVVGHHRARSRLRGCWNSTSRLKAKERGYQTSMPAKEE